MYFTVSPLLSEVFSCEAVGDGYELFKHSLCVTLVIVPPLINEQGAFYLDNLQGNASGFVTYRRSYSPCQR